MQHKKVRWMLGICFFALVICAVTGFSVQAEESRASSSETLSVKLGTTKKLLWKN